MEIVPTKSPTRAPATLLRVEPAELELLRTEAAPEPPEAAPVWGDLRADSWYARSGVRLLTLVLMAVTIVPAVLISLPIALVNWISFRDPRKILFHQPRVGYRGRVFEIYKFRTMRDLGDSDEARVTAFGRFLRSTHLDELPQLLNILRGDMVFIGPRPEMTEIVEWATERIEGFHERLAVRPGITGLSQITQGYTGMDVDAYSKKLDVDRRYCRELTFSLDCRILVRTFVWMLRGRGWSWQGERPDMERDLDGAREAA